MDHANWKCVFEHAQNAQIQIHFTRAQSLIQAFTPTDTVCSVQWFCLRTVKALIR